MRSKLFFLFAMIVLIGCDPGWHYKLLNNSENKKDSVETIISEVDGVKATVSCRLFSMGLTVEIDIENQGSTPLSVDPDLLKIFDSKDVELTNKDRSCE